MPIVPPESGSHRVQDRFDRGHEADVDHSPHQPGSLLHEGAQTTGPAEAHSNQPRTVWSNHHQCPPHTPTKRDGYVQLVWDINGPLITHPSSLPYRSTAPLQYQPGDRSDSSKGASQTLDSNPRAIVTIAQGNDTGGGHDRPHRGARTSGFQPEENHHDYAKKQTYVPSPTDGFSASSSPAVVPVPDDPDSSSSGEPTAAGLPATSNTTKELAETDANPDKGRVATDLVRPHVPPNINVGVLEPCIIPRAKRVGDAHSALHHVRSPPGSSRLAKPGRIKSLLKRNISLASATTDVEVDDTTNLIIDEYLRDNTLTDISLSPIKEFSDIDTLMGPEEVDIDATPSLLIPSQPKYFTITPMPPYFIDLAAKKGQKCSIQNICTLGPGHIRKIETTIQVSERILQRTATPGLKKNTDNPFAKTNKDPTVLTVSYPKHPQFKLAVVDPLYSFPCLTNQQVYPEEQAAQLMADNITITELGALNECETYRWDVIFTAPLHRLERISLTTDESGHRYINLLAGDHIIRWQIVTPHDDPNHAVHSPYTWNTHIYFATPDHPQYVQSYQLK